jgi:hypothetical protein
MTGFVARALLRAASRLIGTHLCTAPVSYTADLFPDRS